MRLSRALARFEVHPGAANEGTAPQESGDIVPKHTLRRTRRLVLLAITLVLAACGGQPAGIAVPAPSNDLKRQNYEVVVAAFKDAGFTNVETALLDDLITGWLTKDGSVESVAINGDTDFGSGDRFPGDARVVITYHTFPKDDPAASASPSPSVTASTVPTPSASAHASPTATAEAEIITADNNQDLAKLLRLTDYSDPSIAVFAEKYAGRTIEFDGNISAMGPHGTAKTRYDIMINAGDFDENKSRGPNFQFRDVNTTSDLHYTGEDIPDSIGVGTNLHIVAKVGTFKDPLFQIKPVATSFR